MTSIYHNGNILDGQQMKRVIGGATKFHVLSRSPFFLSPALSPCRHNERGRTDQQRNGACKACKLDSILIDIALCNSLFSLFSFVIWVFVLQLLFLLFLLFDFFIFLILIIRFINKKNKYYTCYIGCSHSSQF